MSSTAFGGSIAPAIYAAGLWPIFSLLRHDIFWVEVTNDVPSNMAT